LFQPAYDFSEIALGNYANQNYNSIRSVPAEGRFAIVTTRWARDAMDAVASGGFIPAGRKRRQRTAKSCGPGAATLASRWRSFPPANGGKKGRFPGESTKETVKTVARGKPVRIG